MVRAFNAATFYSRANSSSRLRSEGDRADSFLEIYKDVCGSLAMITPVNIGIAEKV
jgi:hypothetical protein